jgi:hypothetical protein
MQYCRQRIGYLNQTFRAPRRESQMVPRSETVRSVIPSLCRVTTDAPPWTSTQISVSGPGFRQAITPL